MISISKNSLAINLEDSKIKSLLQFTEKYLNTIIISLVAILSLSAYLFFLSNGLALAYNDARSHLDIARRVVEGLKPGLAQLGSVWLPLPHFLMIPFVINDTLWHTGFAGAVISMTSFVLTVYFLIKILDLLKSSGTAKVATAAIFALNLNALYLQSTAMTEMLLIALMTGATFFLAKWATEKKITSLITSSFLIFLSTLVRYDGWFLLAMVTVIVGVLSWKNFGKKSDEGILIFFLTLSSFGIILWLLWNALIFKDPFYFAFGPYSARAQQAQVEAAGELQTKGHLLISLKTYWYAMVYNAGLLSLVLGAVGSWLAWKKLKTNWPIFLAISTLFAPIIFNILALVLGHSILFVPEVAGNTWFNVRYGIVALPAIALFSGILIERLKDFKIVLIALLIFVGTFSWINVDAVTIDDARVGSSQKNVSEVSGWLKEHAKDQKGYVLISVASHDAIIFSSGLPMKRFIHEGTGAYWDNATKEPDKWARWIVVRTNDNNDRTWRLIKDNPGLPRYDLVNHYPFADIYQLQDQYLVNLITEPILGKQK